MNRLIKCFTAVTILTLSACSTKPVSQQNKWGVLVVCKLNSTTLESRSLHAMAKSMCSGLHERIGSHGVPATKVYIENRATNIREVLPQALADSPKDGLIQLVISSGSNGMRKETVAEVSYLAMSFTPAKGGSSATMGKGPSKRYILASGDEAIESIKFNFAIDDFEKILVKKNIIQKITF